MATWNHDHEASLISPCDECYALATGQRDTCDADTCGHPASSHIDAYHARDLGNEQLSRAIFASATCWAQSVCAVCVQAAWDAQYA